MRLGRRRRSFKDRWAERNHPTWMVGEWLRKEESRYRRAFEAAIAHRDSFEQAGEALEQVVETTAQAEDLLKREQTIGAKFLSWGLAKVDWELLAEAFIVSESGIRQDMKDIDEHGQAIRDGM